MELNIKMIADKGDIDENISYEILSLEESKRNLARFVARIKFNAYEDICVDRIFYNLNELIDQYYDYIHAEYNSDERVLNIYHKDIIELKLLLDVIIITYSCLYHYDMYGEYGIKNALNEVIDIMWENDLFVDKLRDMSNIDISDIHIDINTQLLPDNKNIKTIYDISNSNIERLMRNNLSKVLNDYDEDFRNIFIHVNDRESVLLNVFLYLATLYNKILKKKIEDKEKCI